MNHFSFLSLLGCIFLSPALQSQPGVAQPSGPKNTAVTMKAEADIFGSRCFIENKGQFENPLNESIKVLFVYDHNGEKVFLLEDGLVYEHTRYEKRREEDEAEEKEEERGPHAERFYVRMKWLGASSAVSVQKSSPGHYVTYGTRDLNAYTYRSVIYKNVYPGIDIEYLVPTNKQSGIKYNIYAKAGADLGKIKMRYSGDVKNVKKDGSDVVIVSPIDVIRDHAPVSYYDDGVDLASQFVVNGNDVSLEFSPDIDATKDIFVDPWVTAVTTLTSTNSAFDVDYDYAGNTYIYGGPSNAPSKIAMYNSSGVLQWTFSGIIASPTWSNLGSVSNFVVEKYTGKSYTGQGVVFAGAQIVRIDNAGNYDNFISTPVSQYREIWELTFNCNGGEILVYGGTTANNMSGATISTLTGAMNPMSFQPGNTGCCQDIVSAAIDNQSNAFVLFASASNTITNHICQVNSTFNGNVWTAPTTFNSMNENGNKTQYQPPVTSNGFNCLAVNNNFLYYYDGYNLAAYSKTNGSLVSSTTISGHVLKRQGGIAVDECDHLYLGGNGSILTYSFNGTAFVSVGAIPLGLSTPTQNVHDVVLDRTSALLYVCGTEFVGTYNANISTSCGSGLISLAATSQSICAGQSVTLTVSGVNNYTWTNVSATGSIAVVSPVSNITYSVIGTRTTACGTVTDVAVKSITVDPAPLVTITGIQKVCKGDKRALSTTQVAGYTYSWSTGSNTWTTSINPTVTTVYSVTVSHATMSCNGIGTHTVQVLDCVGLNEMNSSGTLATIRPNPVHEALTIEMYEPADVFVHNVLGQLFHAEKSSANAGKVKILDTSSWPSGIYFIDIQNERAQQRIKVLKE